MPARIEVDVAEIERLYFDEELNAVQVGAKVGCSPQTVLRRMKASKRPPRASGRAAKHPPVELGVCGTPGCTDPECDVPYGICHCGLCRRRERPRTTPIATRHDRRCRYIKGKHKRFALGHDLPTEEYRRIQSEAMTAKMDELFADPIRKAVWTRARHRTNAGYGRANREFAAAKGNRVGRRLRPEDVEAVRRKVEEIRRLLPTIGDEALVELLMVYFRGPEAVKQLDGRRRPRRDVKYRAARQWVERRLNADAA